MYRLADAAPNAFGYFYIINSKGDILVGLTKHASSDKYKQRIFLYPGESYLDLVWKEEDKRSILISVDAQIFENKVSSSYHYGYLKDNETIILKREKKDKDEIEVNISSDSWKRI